MGSSKSNNTKRHQEPNQQKNNATRTFYLREYRAEEYATLHRLVWHELHPMYGHDWHNDHPDYRKEHAKGWRKRNKEKAKEYARKWRAEHPDYYQEYRKKKRKKLRRYWRKYKRRKRSEVNHRR